MASNMQAFITQHIFNKMIKTHHHAKLAYINLKDIYTFQNHIHSYKSCRSDLSTSIWKLNSKFMHSTSMIGTKKNSAATQLNHLYRSHSEVLRPSQFISMNFCKYLGLGFSSRSLVHPKKYCKNHVIRTFL